MATTKIPASYLPTLSLLVRRGTLTNADVTLRERGHLLNLAQRGLVVAVSGADGVTYTATAIGVDDAYSAELRRVFGKEAGDARYDARGKSTPELRRLSEAKLAADSANRA